MYCEDGDITQVSAVIVQQKDVGFTLRAANEGRRGVPLRCINGVNSIARSLSNKFMLVYYILHVLICKFIYTLCVLVPIVHVRNIANRAGLIKKKDCCRPIKRALIVHELLRR